MKEPELSDKDFRIAVDHMLLKDGIFYDAFLEFVGGFLYFHTNGELKNPNLTVLKFQNKLNEIRVSERDILTSLYDLKVLINFSSKDELLKEILNINSDPKNYQVELIFDAQKVQYIFQRMCPEGGMLSKKNINFIVVELNKRLPKDHGFIYDEFVNKINPTKNFLTPYDLREEYHTLPSKDLTTRLNYLLKFFNKSDFAFEFFNNLFTVELSVTMFAGDIDEQYKTVKKYSEMLEDDNLFLEQSGKSFSLTKNFIKRFRFDDRLKLHAKTEPKSEKEEGKNLTYLKLDLKKQQLIRNGKKPLSFKKTKFSKRFNILKKIVQARGGVLSKDLDKRPSFVSDEKREINERCRNELDINKDLIINNQLNDGYEIDSNLFIVTTI